MYTLFTGLAGDVSVSQRRTLRVSYSRLKAGREASGYIEGALPSVLNKNYNQQITGPEDGFSVTRSKRRHQSLCT